MYNEFFYKIKIRFPVKNSGTGIPYGIFSISTTVFHTHFPYGKWLGMEKNSGVIIWYLGSFVLSLITNSYQASKAAIPQRNITAG